MSPHLFFIALISAVGGSAIGSITVCVLIRRHEKRVRMPSVSQTVRHLTPPGTLNVVVLPRHVHIEKIGDQVCLYDDTRNALLVGENERGGYGFKSPGETYWHGNYATLEDAVRACGHDCFKAKN